MAIACFDFATFSKKPTLGGIQRILFEIVGRWDNQQVTPVFLFELQGNLIFLELEDAQIAFTELNATQISPNDFGNEWDKVLHRSKHQRVAWPSALLMVDVWILAEVTSDLNEVQRLEDASKVIPCGALIYDFLPQTHSEFFITTSSTVSFPYFYSLRKTTGAIAISSQSKLDFFRFLNLNPDERVIVSPPGVDHVNPESITSINGATNILILGKIEPRKHQLEIIKGLRSSLDLPEQITAFLVGENVNPGYYREIEKYVQDEDIESHVNFCGFLSDYELENLISECQISISAGIEGYGLVPLEMLRRGFVVIDAGVTPSIESITHPRLFKLTELQPESVASAISKAIDVLKDANIGHHEIIDTFPTWKDFVHDVGEMCLVLNSNRPKPFCS
jgi:glycosyltransferase involved in cell wall biosynthesis